MQRGLIPFFLLIFAFLANLYSQSSSSVIPSSIDIIAMRIVDDETQHLQIPNDTHVRFLKGGGG